MPWYRRLWRKLTRRKKPVTLRERAKRIIFMDRMTGTR
jgi:hypothetical protein